MQAHDNPVQLRDELAGGIMRHRWLMRKRPLCLALPNAHWWQKNCKCLPDESGSDLAVRFVTLQGY
jgi:hypothetical protein